MTLANFKNPTSNMISALLFAKQCFDQRRVYVLIWNQDPKKSHYENFSEWNYSFINRGFLSVHSFLNFCGPQCQFEKDYINPEFYLKFNQIRELYFGRTSSAVHSWFFFFRILIISLYKLLPTPKSHWNSAKLQC